MAAVFAGSTSRGVSRLLLLALADEASEEGQLTAYRRSRSHLAAKCNCSKDTVRRAVTDLVQLGELTVLETGSGLKSSNYQINLDVLGGSKVATPPEESGGSTHATPGVAPTRPPRSRPRDPGGSTVATPIIPLFPVFPVKPVADSPVPVESSAHSIAEQVWKSKTPRPATPFVAVRKIAQSLLDAGWDAHGIVDAMVAAPTISTRSVEMQLNLAKPKSPRLDTNRDGVSGKVSDGW